jgi:hypothetical protein
MDGAFESCTVCKELTAGTGNLMHPIAHPKGIPKERPKADAQESHKAPAQKDTYCLPTYAR